VRGTGTATEADPTQTGSGNGTSAPPVPTGASPIAHAALPRRFHGSVSLGPTRVGRDAGRIADEVIAHLTGLVGANVNVTLEISAEVHDGVPEKVVRTVTENCRTLKFRDHGFEES